MRTRSNALLLLWLIPPIAAGALGAVASASAPEFYAALAKPSWAPPSWLFGPVWTVLYLMMGLAAGLAWRAKGWSGARGPLTLFLLHLPVNALWSWLFFHWRLGAASVADIALLWLMLAALVVLFLRIHRLAGALLVPYLIWVTYASALNIALWQANGELLR